MLSTEHRMVMVIDSYMKKMMAVFVLSILAVITAEAIRYHLSSREQSEPLTVAQDADPGADDAMALLMLLSPRSRARLVAVTCVAGNTGVANATRNARLVLQLENRTDVALHAGAEQALLSPIQPDHYFGYDGLGDVFPNPGLEAPSSGQHAAIALVDLVKGNPGKVSVLCTGPLTNIALAIHLYPRFMEDVKEMVVLGGSYKGGGNRKPGGEFNFVADPEAAALVFSKALPDRLVKLIPLETVASNPIPLSWRVEVLGELDSKRIHFLNQAEVKTFPKITEWLPFDQLAAAVLLEPRVIAGWVDVRIYLETCGEHGRGTVFVDYDSPVQNTRIITDIHLELFKELLLYLVP